MASIDMNIFGNITNRNKLITKYHPVIKFFLMRDPFTIAGLASPSDRLHRTEEINLAPEYLIVHPSNRLEDLKFIQFEDRKKAGKGNGMEKNREGGFDDRGDEDEIDEDEEPELEEDEDEENGENEEFIDDGNYRDGEQGREDHELEEEGQDESGSEGDDEDYDEDEEELDQDEDEDEFDFDEDDENDDEDYEQ